MAATVSSGRYTYEVNQGWVRLPEGCDIRATAVAVDPHDRVYCFDREGNHLHSGGASLFAFLHAIYVDAQNHVWRVDRNYGQIMEATTQGDLLMTIGSKGFRSNSGATELSSTAYRDVTQGGGPFNMPARICVAPSGDIFIAARYGTGRCIAFHPDGQYLLSWGQTWTRFRRLDPSTRRVGRQRGACAGGGA